MNAIEQHGWGVPAFQPCSAITQGKVEREREL